MNPFPEDTIFRGILIVLVVSILFGALLAVAGESYFGNPAVSRFGVGVVVVCGAIYFVFRLLGRREARRRKDGNGAP